jgi:hypothetical protein
LDTYIDVLPRPASHGGDNIRPKRRNDDIDSQVIVRWADHIEGEAWVKDFDPLAYGLPKTKGGQKRPAWPLTIYKVLVASSDMTGNFERVRVGDGA